MSRPPAVADRVVGLGGWFFRTLFPIVVLVSLVVVPLVFGYSGWVAIGLFFAGVLGWWLTLGLSGSYARTEFGPTERVDMETFRGSKAICNACDSVVSEGLRRRYAKQWVVAGLPMYTADWGENAYCPDCVEPGTLAVRDGRELVETQ
ncbi:MAG: hypothetical protein IH933_06995 [Euryarchaeota archaeon]|jgi:hypothetical protein|nr:hypothetical protein [Euryarchaeota archaeon]